MKQVFWLQSAVIGFYPVLEMFTPEPVVALPVYLRISAGSWRATCWRS